VIVSGKYKDQSGIVASVGNATLKVALNAVFGGATTGNLKFAAVQRC
jgi:transcription antitermination factor NusG